MYFPNYMLPIIFRGKSLVILTEDVYYEINEGTLPWRYKLAYKLFAGWAARHATRIQAISETSAREVSRLFRVSPDKIAVNPLGVNVPTDSCPTSHASYPGPYVLYVGQAFPRRHLKETMLAFEKIAPRFAGLKLIAVGYDKYNPPIINRLKDRINRNLGEKRIIYKEYVPGNELGALYSGAKLVIYVSSKEAFGLPPLEALSYGAVPVVADQSVTREILGDGAFFVENPDEPDSIARAMAEGLTNDKKIEEIKNSAGLILKKYTWSAHADRFIQAARNTAKK
jgi:glycosyltransferase involved in cell wall biosynthesis